MSTRRTSLMQLRPRHLATVEHIARRSNYHRATQHEFMLQNYSSIFGGGLRPKKLEVPSDELRKSLMIMRMLDIVDERREEIHGPAK